MCVCKSITVDIVPAESSSPTVLSWQNKRSHSHTARLASPDGVASWRAPGSEEQCSYPLEQDYKQEGH